MSESKCYAVVRADISPGYQIVQTAHAVAEHEAKHPGSMSGRTMIVLAVPNHILLTLLYEYLARDSEIETSIFWEPDVSEYTAFAVSPHHRLERLFQGLPLAGR